MTTITTINIATLKVSRHAKEDRWNRIVKCVQAVGGLGEVIFTCESTKAKYPGELIVNCVTSTGLVFVVNATKGVIITGYLGSVRYIHGLYCSQGCYRMPDELFVTLRKNERKYSYLYSL